MKKNNPKKVLLIILLIVSVFIIITGITAGSELPMTMMEEAGGSDVGKILGLFMGVVLSIVVISCSLLVVLVIWIIYLGVSLIMKSVERKKIRQNVKGIEEVKDIKEIKKTNRTNPLLVVIFIILIVLVWIYAQKLFNLFTVG